jgi:hypothetical protein
VLLIIPELEDEKCLRLEVIRIFVDQLLQAPD